MTEEFMREVEEIKESLKERIRRDGRDAHYRFRFFNHFLRLYGDRKTPQELLTLAVERDESLYFREHGEDFGKWYRRIDDADITALRYDLKYRELLHDDDKNWDKSFILSDAVFNFIIDDCRTREEEDFYMAIPPKELVAMYKAEQIEIYGEEEIASQAEFYSHWEDPAN